jgi:phosphoglycerol transferase MdoB-like AlkP superfamily enzyme
LNGYREHFSFIRAAEAGKLLLIYLIATALLLLFFRLIFRNWLKAGVASFAVMSIQLFFGAMHDFLKSIMPGSFFSKYSFVLPLLFVCLVVIFFLLARTRNQLSRLALYLNVLFLVLIAIELTLIVTYSVSSSKKETRLSSEYAVCPDCETPDLYVIIADEYAGAKSLKEVFAFDNSPFIAQLNMRGFQVAESGKSNYNFTPYSIASTLDMNYLRVSHSNKKELLKHTYETTRNNNLLKFLTAHGYEFHNLSLLDYPGYPSPTEETFLPVQTRLITSQTFLSRINKELRFNLVSKLNSEKEQRRVIYTPLNNNNRLIELTENTASLRSPKPKFVLTHLMMPHYPYYFNSKGELFPFDQLGEGNQHRKENYIEYLQYCNGKLLQLIDNIHKSSLKKPVIVLLGDHGFRHLPAEINTDYFFNNLIAVSTPDSNNHFLPDNVSNVNVFRSLLNKQFNQQLPYLADSTFIMENP